MNLKTQKTDLTVVIPALNEEKRLGGTLDKLAEFLKENQTLSRIIIEVIVVSADGIDKTHEIALEHGKKIQNFRLLKPGARVGKGRDVKYGMLEARGDVVMFMDADLATPLKYIPRFYKLFSAQQNDLVVATRNLRKHHSNPLRRILSNSGNLLFRLLGGVWIEDSQCGFKMFSRHAAKICFEKQTINKWGFDMELLAIAKANKLSIRQVRINDWKHVPDGTFEDTRIIHNALDSFRELLIIAKNRFSGKYRSN